MKTLLAALTRLAAFLASLEARAALRPAPVPVPVRTRRQPAPRRAR